PSRDLMNSLAKSVLTLYAFDENAEDTSIANVIAQSLRLIAQFPSLLVYAYHSFAFTHKKQNFVIKSPKKEYSIAQNILYMLRSSDTFTEHEAKVLDLALVLHAEHGGGNNSTFTTHVVSSSGTDTYSCIAASLASLKGPKHGGANIKVVQMFEDMKKN
ncbi:MAG TPA: citrate synthase, partial [Treponema sp.]|nr:citrate synthase [Treponema sp.]